MSLLNKPLFKLFLTFLIIYAVFARVDGWIENSRLDLTRAIVDEGRFTIDSYANNTGDRAYYNGHYYTDKFPGASFIAVPFYFVYKNIIGVPSINDNFYSYNLDPVYLGMVYFVIVFTSALFSALTVILIFKISKYFTKNKFHRYIVAIAYGLGTIAFSQATLFFGHPITTFFLFGSFYLIFRMKKEKKDDNSFLAGLLSGMAFLIEPASVVVIFGLGMLVLSLKSFNILIKFILGLAFIISFLFMYNDICFDSPFSVSYKHLDRELFYPLLDEIDLYDCYYSNPNLLHYFTNKSKICKQSLEIIYDSKQNIILSEKVNGVKTKELISKKVDDFGNSYSWITNHSVSRNKRLISFQSKTLKNPDDSSMYTVFLNKDNSWKKIKEYNLSNNHLSGFESEEGFFFEHNCPVWPLNHTLLNSKNKQNFSCRIDHLFKQEGSIYSSVYIYGTLDIKDINVSNKHISLEVIIDLKWEKLATNFFTRLLFYPYRGLFFFNPVLLLSLIGLFFMLKNYKPEVLFMLFSTIGVILFYSFNGLWWFGTSFGPRNLLIIIPFLIIPLLFVFKRINIYIIFAVLFFSFLINLSAHQILEQDIVSIETGVNYSPEYWSKLDSFKPIANPLFEYYLPLFFKQGPQSLLLEKLFGINLFPFINIIFLSIIVIFFWRKEVFNFLR